MSDPSADSPDRPLLEHNLALFAVVADAIADFDAKYESERFRSQRTALNLLSTVSPMYHFDVLDTVRLVGPHTAACLAFTRMFGS